MSDVGKLFVPLSEVSRYPDVDVDRLLAAASSAWASSGRSSLEEVAAVAISYLPSKASDFERGIVSGIVLSRFLADQAKP